MTVLKSSDPLSQKLGYVQVDELSTEQASLEAKLAGFEERKLQGSDRVKELSAEVKTIEQEIETVSRASSTSRTRVAEIEQQLAKVMQTSYFLHALSLTLRIHLCTTMPHYPLTWMVLGARTTAFF